MKWILLFLFAANIIVFAWGHQRDWREMRSAKVETQDVPGLVLLSEIEAPSPGDRADRFNRVEKAVAVATRQAVQESRLQPEPAEPPQQLPPRLPMAEVPVQSPEPPAAVAPPGEVPRCFSVGPFDSAELADLVQRRLATMGFAAREREVIRRKENGFFVALPPQPTMADAQREVARLNEAGITDTWLFREGDLQNVVSLGLYTRKLRAEEYRDRLEKKGLITEVRPRYSEQKDLWVDFRLLVGDEPFPNTFKEELMEQEPELEFVPLVCKEFVTR